MSKDDSGTPSRKLRSDRWFAPDDLRSFGHRSRMMQLGYSEEEFRGKPIIGILNTWSEINSCHSHFRERAADVKRGVAQGGGLGVEMPSLSVDESFTKPTSMLYRNMLAMEAEEMIRSHPFDGVVLMGGCDKTTPGLVMGALTAGVPFIYLPAGPMLRGNTRAASWGRAPTPSSTGTRSAPAPSPTRNGRASRGASPAPTATA